MYNFSDEDELEDAILNRAMDRWEQMGGSGATSGPLFKFKMVAIGKRRTWRDVVRRDTFNAELIQLRQPVPTDNIGHALTESLYNAIANELQRQQRPNHHGSIWRLPPTDLTTLTNPQTSPWVNLNKGR